MIGIIVMRITVTVLFEIMRIKNDFSDTNEYSFEIVLANVTELLLVGLMTHSIRWSIERNKEFLLTNNSFVSDGRESLHVDSARESKSHLGALFDEDMHFI